MWVAGAMPVVIPWGVIARIGIAWCEAGIEPGTHCAWAQHLYLCAKRYLFTPMGGVDRVLMIVLWEGTCFEEVGRRCLWLVLFAADARTRRTDNLGEVSRDFPEGAAGAVPPTSRLRSLTSTPDPDGPLGVFGLLNWSALWGPWL